MTGDLTNADVEHLEAILKSGDRGGFYLKYHQLTGSEQALQQAQISTFSNETGSFAIAGNIRAKEAKPDLYTDTDGTSLSLSKFSDQIADALLTRIKTDVVGGSSQNGLPIGHISNDEMQKIDLAVWASKGLEDYFPGNTFFLGDAANAVWRGKFSTASKYLKRFISPGSTTNLLTLTNGSDINLGKQVRDYGITVDGTFVSKGNNRYSYEENERLIIIRDTQDASKIVYIEDKFSSFNKFDRPFAGLGGELIEESRAVDRYQKYTYMGIGQDDPELPPPPQPESPDDSSDSILSIIGDFFSSLFGIKGASAATLKSKQVEQLTTAPNTALDQFGNGWGWDVTVPDITLLDIGEQVATGTFSNNTLHELHDGKSSGAFDVSFNGDAWQLGSLGDDSTWVAIDYSPPPTTTPPTQGTCFAAGTLIRLADGTEKPIENIAAGDEVLAFAPAPECVGAPLVACRVVQTFVHDGCEVFDISGTHVTAEHPFQLSDGRFVEVRDIPAGAQLVRDDGTFVAFPGAAPVPGRHRTYNFEIDWLVLPPVQLRQFRIWRRDNQPIGYASWAYLSDESAARFADGASGTKLRRIAPGEWKSGGQLWLVDVVSPFGGADGMVRELREKVFAGQKVKTLQNAPDGSGVAVVEW